jgi:hypothetical protein
MKRSALVLLCALLTLPVTARTFTNKEGKTIEAEITTADTKTVTLKLLDGTTSRINLDQLSEADLTFVKAWLTDKIPDLRITPNFVRSNRDIKNGSSSYSDGNDSRRIQVLDLSVHFESWDKTTGIDDAQLTYILVGRSMEARSRYKILAVQNTDFSIAPAGQASVDFKTVKNFYDDSPNSGAGARCVGYVLYAKRKSDAREIHASASSPLLEKAIQTIVTLKAGEETDDNFIKILDPEESASRDKSGVITVK